MDYYDEREIIDRAKKRKSESLDLNFHLLIILTLFLIAFLAGRVHAATRRSPVPQDRCIVRLDNRTVAKVPIAIDGTVLDFPLKPTKVILGRKNSFGIEYVESDLAVSPLSQAARSHLYVYLEGRRFSFDLSTTSSGGCAIILVRDSHDNQVSVDGQLRFKK